MTDSNPEFSKRHAYHILHMIRDVFEDFEVNEPCDLENQEFFAYDADLEYGGIYEKIPFISEFIKNRK